MSKAEKTKQFIIEKSSSIFNKKGYAGTSLNDLIDATGLTKGSVYGNFKNKDEVALAVYKYNVAGLNKRMNDFIKEDASSAEKLIAFTEFYRSSWKKMFERGGCPIQNASIESDDNLDFLKKTVQESIRSWAKKLSVTIDEGKQSGEFKKTISSEEYAFTIITVLEGGIMLSKIMNNPNLLFSALDRIVVIINKEIIK